ncbi:glycosyltransferase [Desulfosporosinus fructosivorans]|uniref:Glycosyltransferase n=1 Tax=Desulfosporosinus fructosivorans TaxID=2018669 RepID=A0A4Z0QWS5_9FIRM|nr:glycosyltransferase family 4 protein [Desulfosporosinus fructosivorans]TGE34860.1 glycosyltransferase [Desulfosporosinus fructosivorans]
MKILHINSYYNGSCFYKNLFDKQQDSGLDISVYVPMAKGTPSSTLNLGEYTTTSPNHGKYDRVLFHIKHRKIYKDIIKKFEMKEFDIVHAHSLFSNGYIALRLKKIYGLRYIVAVRNTDVNTFFKYMIHLRKLGVDILNEAEKVIFLSKPYRDFVIERYVPTKLKKEILNKTEIIPNGIDDFWLKNLGTSRASSGHNNLRLVYAGVINKNKNLKTTVKAIGLLQKKGYDVQFTVIGRIADKSIHQQIISLPFVKYIEPKPKEELIEIYCKEDIFIMPSIKESFGLVYAEAMSQGLPVIYTKGQGFDGQFEEGLVGYHVDCFNAEEIARRIIDIYSDYQGMSERCRVLSDTFDWKSIAPVYFDIYKSIVLR